MYRRTVAVFLGCLTKMPYLECIHNKVGSGRQAETSGLCPALAAWGLLGAVAGTAGVLRLASSARAEAEAAGERWPDGQTETHTQPYILHLLTYITLLQCTSNCCFLKASPHVPQSLYLKHPSSSITAAQLSLHTSGISTLQPSHLQPPTAVLLARRASSA